MSRRLGLPYPVPQPELWKEVLIAVSISLLLAGAALPAWGPRRRARQDDWAMRYLACRRLYPLWRDLSSPCPTWRWCRRSRWSPMPSHCLESNCGSRVEWSRFGTAV